MKLIRIEHASTGDSLWYSQAGLWQPTVQLLSSTRLKELPMPFDQKRYRRFDKNWLCACPNIEALEQWFTRSDRHELYEIGYGLFEIETDDFIVEENQIIFNKDAVISKIRVAGE